MAKPAQTFTCRRLSSSGTVIKYAKNITNKKNNTVWKKIFAVKIKKFPYRKRKIPKIKLHFTKGVKMWMNVVQ